MDVAIIGGGFAGLSAALHLRKTNPAARVVVLEAERIGCGASGRTTGLLGPGVGQSLNALVRRFGRDRARSLYQASLDAVAAARNIVADECIDCELEMNGHLIVGRSAAGRRRLGAMAHLLESFSFPVEILEKNDLDNAIQLGPQAYKAEGKAGGPAALRLPFAGTLHPAKLLAGLANAASRRGARIFENARVLEIGPGSPVHLKIHGGKVIADQVVIATAGYTTNLGLLRGRILPVLLQVLATEPLNDEALASLGWKRREGILDSKRIFNYCRLTKDNRIVFGGGAPRYRCGAALSESREGSALRTLTAELTGLFPILERTRIRNCWTGVIGYIADGVPAVARMRGQPAVLHVVGWCGHGVALSIASGSWIARMIAGDSMPDDLPWFRDDPPLIPFEPLRWLAFRGAVCGMSVLDRLEGLEG